MVRVYISGLGFWFEIQDLKARAYVVMGLKNYF